MHRLDYFKNHPPENAFYHQRKLVIPDAAALNLHGVRGSGKTALIVDHLKNFPNEGLLYIDCEDPSFLLTPLCEKEIQDYIVEHSIRTLVLDHFDTTKIAMPPQTHTVILITRRPVPVDNFSRLQLFPLDYEEFLVFEKGASQAGSFNHFLKFGTLPLVSKSPTKGVPDFKTFLLSRFDHNEITLLIILAFHQTHHLTINQIYVASKERLKISKDWLYRKINSFEEEGILYFLEDSSKKSGKKLILFDFAITKYLVHTQPFFVQFDTMVALALIKHQRYFTTLGIHGYLINGDELLIASAFESEESVWKKSHGKYAFYRSFAIKKVTIVTIANNYNFEIADIVFEALPFYEWSILNEEE